MSRGSARRPRKLEVMVMFEPTRLGPLVLQTAYLRVAPIRHKPLDHRRASPPDETAAAREAPERSAP